ncbi:hypothetical protein [Terricaulis sp.]|uniref:hypothetical protein n=1 Tax=Terricaulis sp. TaxID=2768686 RepID=UPI003783525B
MSQYDFTVLVASAAVVLLMIGIAGLLGFRQSAKLDDGELARLAEAEGARIEGAAVDAKGRNAIARLEGGKLMIARVMADGVSTRVLAPAQARVRLAQGKLSVTFADLGYPSLNMRLDNPPAWLAELGARP